MDKPTPGIRKRQQILRANQAMFIWVAAVSVVVGFSLVMIVFLGQKIAYGEKVIAEKNKTAATLDRNLEVVDDLKDNIRVLNTDENLNAVRLNGSGSALQVVLDALPAQANSTAMASSLQTQLLGGVPGVTLESLRVDPVVGIEVDEGSATSSGSSDDGGNTIGFSFTVSTQNGGQEGLRDVLLRLERSIRPFTIVTLSIETLGNRITMTGTGLGYYEPAQELKLIDKVVRP